ncbi:MAG: hypothetical protein GF388_02120 [Candidatus Aegiribacteria sp.]|nr:hypothetical protein [Candidatus Aegiribacteria sp.]
MTEHLDERVKPDRTWYHGSTEELTLLRTGSSVTPFREIAKAYSHKPKQLELSVLENTDTSSIHVDVTHDGDKPGFLYEVLINNQAELRTPEENLGPLGEEMVTTKEYSLRLIGETDLRFSYSFDLDSITQRKKTDC